MHYSSKEKIFTECFAAGFADLQKALFVQHEIRMLKIKRFWAAKSFETRFLHEKAMNNMKFIFITDTHYGGPDDKGYRQQPRYNIHAEELLDALADFIQQEEVSFVLHGGDLVDWGNRTNIRLAACLMKRLPCPVHLSPGNHDLTEDDSVSAWLEEAPQLFPGGGIDFTIVEDGVRLDALCANWGPRKSFWNMAEPQLPWFAEEQKARLFDGPQDMPRIIVSHAQPCGLPPEQTGMEHDLHAPHEPFQQYVRETCSVMKPLAWLGGHNHMTLRRDLNGTQLVTAPAFSEAPFEAKLFEYKAEERTLSMRTISFSGRVGFHWSYDFDKTYVQGRPCERVF